ncbi:MAG: HAD family hydrolase [Planctomycetes bacterium]|nr:HAD family hydrolase [Planctomycetota bacterium]
MSAPRPHAGGRAQRPDLLIFDVDGTLHDTFAWWAPVIRRGVELFGRREGIAVPPFDDRFAEGVVGMKDAGVWAPFLPAEHQHRWRDLRAVVLPLEIAEISSGRDYLFDGVRPLLDHLRALGVALAIASNCRAEYLEGICTGQGLRALTDWQFCLDSDGVADKTDMLRCAVAAAGAARPVMVGDREPDLEAAQALDIPFVWRANPRCDLAAAADFVWHGSPDELLGQLGLPRIS